MTGVLTDPAAACPRVAPRGADENLPEMNLVLPIATSWRVFPMSSALDARWTSAGHSGQWQDAPLPQRIQVPHRIGHHQIGDGVYMTNRPAKQRCNALKCCTTVD